MSAPASATAGEEFNITVTARDRNGADVMTDYAGTVHFTSTDGEAFLPADYQFTREDGGVQTFAVTLFDAGHQTITVADTVADPADRLGRRGRCGRRTVGPRDRSPR